MHTLNRLRNTGITKNEHLTNHVPIQGHIENADGDVGNIVMQIPGWLRLHPRMLMVALYVVQISMLSVDID